MADDAWKNFELSGKISDYLDYRQLAVTNTHWQESEQMTVLGSPGFPGKGMGSYGTERGSDRDDLKCNADWRL